MKSNEFSGSDSLGELEMEVYQAEVMDLLSSISGTQPMREPLLALQALAARCFSQEESRMLSCHFPDAERHLEEHSHFLHLLQEMANAAAGADRQALLHEMRDQIERHFNQEDHRLMKFCQENCPSGLCPSQAFSPACKTTQVHPLHIDASPYLLGDDAMDVDHAQLVEIVNALTSGRLDYEAALSALEKYGDHHFAMEEERMRQCAYPEYPEHVAAHDNFRLRMRWLRDKPLDADLAPELLHRYLGLWLVNHILHVDRRLAVFLKDHGG